MIGLATITLYVKHYKDDDSVEHIDIKQTLTGGIEGTEENRTLDWKERSVEDRVFGHVSTCCVLSSFIVWSVVTCMRQLASLEGARWMRSTTSF